MDPYVLVGSSVLRNKAGLTDQATLTDFEAVSVLQRSEEPLPNGKLTPTHYRAVHRHLFQDVYDWAGQLRRIRIFKDGSPFCYPENLRQQLVALFDWLKSQHYLRGLDEDDFAKNAAHFLSELNAIHAFRDGNGRAQATFMALVAMRAGHPLDFGLMNPEAFLQAMVRSFLGDNAPLEQQIRRMIETAR